MASATKLDLDTLQADTPEGTLQAERAGDSYVCPTGDGRAIDIAFLDDVTAAEEQDHQQQIVVYLYDREELAVMIGEVDAEGAAMLESGDLSDFDATVELTIDDAVSGTATFPGERPTPFTADAATGIAQWSMTSIDRTAYPHVRSQPSGAELTKVWSPYYGCPRKTIWTVS